MRELTDNELESVSGGFDFVDSVATGSAIGATGYGGLTLAAGYSLGAITAAFGAGAAIGGLAGAVAYGSYTLATWAGGGALGSAIGHELAVISAD